MYDNDHAAGNGETDLLEDMERSISTKRKPD
jgi:hypothetical protein